MTNLNHPTEHDQSFAAKPIAEPRRKNSNKIWIIVLALLALPVGLPLIIGLGAGLIGLVAGLAAFVIAFFVSGLTFFVGGAVSLLATPFVIVQDLSFGLITGGMGLLFIGGSIIFIKVVFWVINAVCAAARAVGRRIFRRA